MKHTEQRWMRKSNGHMAERGFTPDRTTTMDVEDYRLVTVTWDEPEWEEVEVVRMYCPECQTVMTKKEHEQNNCCKNAVELRGTYRRRKPEPEPQVWEGMAKYTIDGAVIFTPKEFAGKRVRVEVIP